jgi:hypothetical protein
VQFGNLGFKGENARGFGFAVALARESKDIRDRRGVLAALFREDAVGAAIIFALGQTETAMCDRGEIAIRIAFIERDVNIDRHRDADIRS